MESNSRLMVVEGMQIISHDYMGQRDEANSCDNHSKRSFGGSPAVAAFAIGFRSPLDQLLLTVFVLCGLTRLARFNVTVSTLPKDASGKSKYFEGTPIPTTMGIAALMAYLAYHGSIHEQLPFGIVAEGTLLELHPMVLMFSIHGSLMISKSLHIPKP